MLGVLLARAGAGQRWPRPADAADLIRGALKIRLRPAPADEAYAQWRDALAIFSVIAPPLMLVEVVASAAFFQALSPGRPGGELLRLLTGLRPTVDVPLVLSVLVLLRFRRTALVVAVAMTAWLSAQALHSPGSWGPGLVLAFFYVPLAAALAWSPGPRRGLALFRRGQVPVLAMTVLAVLAHAAAESGPGQPLVTGAWLLLAMAAVAMAAAASPLSRRVLVLFAIPGLPYLAAMLAATGPLLLLPNRLHPAILCVPSLVVGCLVLAAILRARHHAATPAPRSAER